MSLEESGKIVDKAAGLRQQQALRRMKRREAVLSAEAISSSAKLAQRKAHLVALEAATRSIEADLLRSNLSRSQTPSIASCGRGDLITFQAPSSTATPPITPGVNNERKAATNATQVAGTTTMVDNGLPLEKLDQKPWLFPKCNVDAMRDPYLRRYGLHRNDTHLMSHIVRSQVSRIDFSQNDDVNFDFQGFLKYAS